MDSNRYAPPKAVVEDIAAQHTSGDILNLPVSDSWKAKFFLLEKAGGVKMTGIKRLSAARPEDDTARARNPKATIAQAWVSRRGSPDGDGAAVIGLSGRGHRCISGWASQAYRRARTRVGDGFNRIFRLECWP